MTDEKSSKQIVWYKSKDTETEEDFEKCSVQSKIVNSEPL